MKTFAGMAPKVQVPTDFGRHLIGTPAHSNFVLTAKDGKELKASSVILSFNSPVIENITTNLGMTTLDCDEFSAIAVESFVLSCYVGELESCTDSKDDIKPMFRDLNKMALVFEVQWLLSECSEFFREMLCAIDGEDYAEMLNLFEEALYIFKEDQKRRSYLMDLIIERIQEVDGTDTFLSNYLKDFKDFTQQQVDLIIWIAGNEVEIIVQYLLTEIASHIDDNVGLLTDNMKYLLSNTDLSICRVNDRALYETLFDTLQSMENTSKEDMKLVFGIYRKSSMERKRRSISLDENSKRKKIMSRISESSDEAKANDTTGDNDPAEDDLPVALINTKIPNLFHKCEEFEHLGFQELFVELTDNPDVTNLFIFAEALYTWMDFHPRIGHTPNWINQIVKLMEDQDWGGIPLSFISTWKFGSRQNIKSFFGMWETCDGIVDENNGRSPWEVVPCYAPATITWQQLCGTETKFRFKFKHPINSDCRRSGNCGFILKSTVPNPDSPDLLYNIELSTDPADYKKYRLHLHDYLVRAKNMYFVLERMYGDVPCCIPISWSGRPSLKGKYWTWGKFKFANESPVKISVLLDYR